MDTKKPIIYVKRDKKDSNVVIVEATINIYGKNRTFGSAHNLGEYNKSKEAGLKLIFRTLAVLTLAKRTNLAKSKIIDNNGDIVADGYRALLPDISIKQKYEIIEE